MKIRWRRRINGRNVASMAQLGNIAARMALQRSQLKRNVCQLYRQWQLHG
jgi:hypothetical protein